jgi:hypothetical protein
MRTNARSRQIGNKSGNKIAGRYTPLPVGWGSHIRGGVMPSPGLSLVGFMNETQAIPHLTKICFPAANSTDDQIRAEWNAARAKLGEPFAKAGQPDILPIPEAHAGHVTQLIQQQWVQGLSDGQLTPAHIWLVEIDPLLAFQFTVNLDRSAHHCTVVAQPPAYDELLKICLPLAQTPEKFDFLLGAQSLILRSRTLNLGIRTAGVFNGAFGGFVFGPVLPFVHVTRVNGRCFLFDGYHRAVGLSRAGATHVPCIVRDVPDLLSAGVKSDGSTFGESIFAAAHVPTIGHFARGRAHEVSLRATSRIMHVSWAEYAWQDE